MTADPDAFRFKFRKSETDVVLSNVAIDYAELTREDRRLSWTPSAPSDPPGYKTRGRTPPGKLTPKEN